jgi:hypothetical protein
MTTNPQPDPLLWSARKERAGRWAASELRGDPALGAEKETEAALAAEPDERARPSLGRLNRHSKG